MYEERKHAENIWQLRRKQNLMHVVDMIKEFGGFKQVFDNINDFARHVSFEIGCTPKTALEYIHTIRAETIFKSRKHAENIIKTGEKLDKTEKDDI